MRNDHAELWTRPKGVRSAGTPRRRRRERCEDTEHRAAVREAKGRLGPGNLEGEARKYAGPYPRAAKGEGAGETGEGGAKMRDDHCELRKRTKAPAVHAAGDD